VLAYGSERSKTLKAIHAGADHLFKQVYLFDIIEQVWCQSGNNAPIY